MADEKVTKYIATRDPMNPAGATQSPTPPRKKPVSTGTMDFPQAIQAVIEGHRITKQEWDDEEIYGQLRKNTLMIHLEDGWHQWIINDGDLLGDDWITLE
jgi:hypothetical protein